jgi:ferredoxin
VSDFLERRIGRFLVRIDRNLCVGFGDCIDVADHLLVLDDDNVARFRDDADAADADDDTVLRMCRACPVDALSATDESGAQVAP